MTQQYKHIIWNDSKLGGYPPFTLEDFLKRPQSTIDEQNYLALLRKIYCRLWVRCTNNSTSTQTVQLFGGYSLPGAETQTSSDLGSEEEYISLGTVTVTGSLGRVQYLEEDTDLAQVWILDSRGLKISVMNARTRAVLITFSTAFITPSAASYKTGTGQMYVLFQSIDGNTTINVYDTTTYAILDTFNVGNPDDSFADIQYSATANKFYVSGLTTNNIEIIDGATNTVTTIASGITAPRLGGYNSSTNTMYFISWFDNDICVVDCSTGTASVISLSATNLPLSIAYDDTENAMFVVTSFGGTTWLNRISSTNVITEFLLDLNGAQNVATQNNQIFVTDSSSSSVLVIVNSGTTYTTIYSIPVAANPGKIKPMTVGNIYVTHLSTVEVIAPGITITGSADYNFIQRQITYEPIIIKHTHISYSERMLGAFQIVFADSSGHTDSDSVSMTTWSSARNHNDLVQHILSFNDIQFDGARRLQFDLPGESSIFIEFFYVQARLLDMVRKGLLR